MDSDNPNLEPGTSSVRLREVSPRIGFCAVIVSLAHPNSVIPALHPNPIWDRVLRDGLERHIASARHYHILHTYDSNPPSDLRFARQTMVSRALDPILGPVNIQVVTHAYGRTREEIQANAARVRPQSYPYCPEDETSALRELRMRAGIVTAQDMAEQPATQHDPIPWIL